MCRSSILAFAVLAAGSCAVEQEDERRSVLFVTVDTLRADHLGLYGYERETSPALDRFADGATVFDHAVAQTSWTLGSLASLLTSRWVSSLGIRNFRSALDEEATTLAEVLRDAGYETAGIGTHVVFQEKYGLLQGIDAFDGDLVHGTYADSHRAITSKKVTDKALAWLGERRGGGRPWFLWLHYFDPHIPYARHPGITERFGDDGIDRYDGEIAFTDRHLGRVLEALEQRDERPIVVVTADHGEEFQDHGDYEHGHTLYRELVRVPLIVSAPHLPGSRGRRVPDLVRLVDVAPTVLELAGVPADRFSAATPGRSFLPLLSGRPDDAPRPALSELRLRTDTSMDSLVSGRFKLVVRHADAVEELFDIESDPFEQNDIAEWRPGRVAGLRKLLEELLAEGEKAPAVEIELDDDEVRALEDLGYLGADD